MEVEYIAITPDQLHYDLKKDEQCEFQQRVIESVRTNYLKFLKIITKI